MIVAINKPKGPTSHDIIYQVRRATGIKRVGHAGTLDPAAAGVLVIAIGREFTKKLGEIVQHDKEYVTTIRLGATSTTEDGEGVITEDGSLKLEVGREQIDEVLKKFVGTIMQIPPIYSAIKMKGKKAYELARQGKELVMEPREVTIYSIEVLSYRWPNLEIKVHCGKGVYIRSLARDIGKELGVGGYMAELLRTRVGKYSLKESLKIEELEKFWMQKSR